MSETLAVHARNLRRGHHEGPGLSGIDFDVRPGTVVALVNSDPAPTASFIRTLDGRDHRVEGTLLVSGTRVLIGSDSERRGIVGPATLPARRSRSLRQLRRIERAIDRKVPLILLVDPLRGLGAADRSRLATQLRTAVRRDRLAVVLSASDREHAAEVADRIDVLADGRIETSLDIVHPTP